MTFSPNQFRQTTDVGYLDLQTGLNNVLTCVHLADEATPLVPGNTVKLADNFTAIPSVEASAITEVAFGVAVRNLKDADFPAEARLEIAREGTVMFMMASAAIARGAEVQYNPTTNKVATQASTNATLGVALDKAAADTDIIRVIIKPSSNA
jgi:predicted RecA/RadA family phage recombinase